MERGEMLAGLKVFWINLDRCVERRAAMEAQLDGVDALRIAGVDGSRGGARAACAAIGLADADRSEAEAACVLSHLAACRAARDGGAALSLVLEDDVVLDRLSSPLAAVAAAAPVGWSVLQLACNNAEVERGLLAAGAPFVPWYRHHWGAGAYLLSRDGAAAAADPARVSPDLGKVVADESVFWRPGAYTFTRPLLGDAGAPSAIQSREHTDLVQGPSRIFRAAYFGQRKTPRALAAVFGSGDPLVRFFGVRISPSPFFFRRALDARAGPLRRARLRRRRGDLGRTSPPPWRALAHALRFFRGLHLLDRTRGDDAAEDRRRRRGRARARGARRRSMVRVARRRGLPRRTAARRGARRRRSAYFSGAFY